MKTITIILTLFLALVLFTENKVQAFVYTLDINIPDIDAINSSERVGGFEFIANPSNSDLSYELGDAIPSSGNWIFETFPSNNICSLSDDYKDLTDLSDIAPMLNGRIITITSEIELVFEEILFYDFFGTRVPTNSFSYEGFNLAPVPIPGALFLLGSGLIGIIGVRRKQMNK